MEAFEISAEARSGLGKGETRRLRRQGLVPAVIYGGGKPPMTVSLRANILRRQLENEAFYSHLLNVKTPEGNLQAVLKDLQRHPATSEVMHVDLLRTSATQVLSMTVPLHFANEDTAPGVKLGGVVSHIVNEVDISCQAKDCGLKSKLAIAILFLQVTNPVPPLDPMLAMGSSGGTGLVT